MEKWKCPHSRLLLTEKLDTDDAERAKAAPGKHLSVRKSCFPHRRAADPTLVSVIQLIGDAAAWLPLRAAAIVYISTLAKRVADATWDGLAKLLTRTDVEPLADVATALTETAHGVGGKVEIVIGLDVPDGYFGTAMRPSGSRVLTTS